MVDNKHDSNRDISLPRFLTFPQTNEYKFKHYSYENFRGGFLSVGTQSKFLIKIVLNKFFSSSEIFMILL